jgi:ariadne-1
MAKNSSESETTNWVLANAKHCPKCRRPIEKSSGCNHMTCSSPCHHEFCWLCLGDWRPHVAGVYKCNRYDVDVADHRREQAQASLDRYLHYYERWAAHELSRQRARDDMFELESALEACGENADEAHAQIGFLMDAYKQILEGRRMLRWTYAYGFYAEGAKLTLLECLQGEAEASLERLHGFAELERNSAEMDFDGGVSYFKTLAKLTKQTANYFESMAEAFQTDLA